ncbi:MAG: hypothetical protein H0X72_12170 [Acidobacteria bacterium]|jgi:hypothetical protein|nr:hypothetical protein [Acidobacteriota bacterium]
MRYKTEKCIECEKPAKDGKYCNSCRYKKRKQYYQERYINNGGYQAYKLKYRKIRLNPFKEIIRKRACDSCEKCGWNKYYDILQAHHINRNRDDNSPENYCCYVQPVIKLSIILNKQVYTSISLNKWQYRAKFEFFVFASIGRRKSMAIRTK